VLRIKLLGNIRNSQFIIISHLGLNPTEQIQEFLFKTNEVGSVETMIFSRLIEDNGDLCELKEINLEKLP